MDMEKIFQIIFSTIPEAELVEFLTNPSINPKFASEFYVVTNTRKTPTFGLQPFFPGYFIYDLNKKLLGEIIVAFNFDAILLTFYLKENKHKEVFVKFITSLLEEMRFVGFAILGTREFGEDPIGSAVENRFYLPKTEKSKNKWKKVYKIICDMREEESDTDELDVYIPTLGDYRDRVKVLLQLDYSEKTISRIIKAGDSGRLD